MGKKLNSSVFPGMQGGPLMHVIAAKAVALKEAMQPEFKTYQGQVVKNAAAMADEFIKLGFKLVSGGTDNHLMLMDLSETDVTGKDGQIWLDDAWITVNKNTVPNETRSPFVTSGIRIGTPAVTTRGMKEAEVRNIAGMIARILNAKGNPEVIETVRREVGELTSKFPIYQEH
jgi:glycine hydroxymethyltransferase